MESIMCKKDCFKFKKNEIYSYWNNFMGLNHFVKYGKEGSDYVVFKGPTDKEVSGLDDDIRPNLYDYFYTLEEMRDNIINILIN